MNYFLAFLILIFAAGCAHSPQVASDPATQVEAAVVDASTAPASPLAAKASDSPSAPHASSGHAVDPFEEEYVDDEGDDEADRHEDEIISIADPIEPFNRAMYHFNDKMYFWVLKPVATGYNLVVPEPARISAKNFFGNLGYPARLLSCLLQADFKGAATETGRFAVNTLWGAGGLLDPAGSGDINLQKQDVDLGQTLGVYGVGHGFFIMWPVYGPSSPRDSLTIVGDHFLYPPGYIEPWYAWLSVWSYEKINAASLRIGDYESLKGAAIDPYVAMRDGYIQYRMKSVKARKEKSLLFRNAAGEGATKE
ncbi:MAG: VacJ family lipoprotein [Smithellaceae bacterium]